MTRTITTVSELDALPVESVVMCDDEHGVAKRVDADIYDGYDWLVVGSDEYRETHEMTWVLPAVVLHDPSAPVVPSATHEEVRDEIAGHPIGSGYYATSVGVDEAFEIADALLDRFTITPRTDR